MWLVAGLGNPGPKYQRTRHNIGFAVLDRLLESHGLTLHDRFRGEWAARGETGYLKPSTFMNASGESISEAVAFYEIPTTQVVVVHDELDLPWGDVRVKLGGGSAGNNGLKSIIQRCGADFVRVRVGIGKPREGSILDWVLGEFDSEESASLPDVLTHAAQVADAVVELGPAAAQNQFNARPRG